MTVPFVREMQDRNRSRRFWESRSARSTDSRRTVAGTTVPRTKCGGYRGCKAVCTTSSPCLPLWMDRGMMMCLVKRKKASSICYRRRYECLLELSSSLWKILIVLTVFASKEILTLWIPQKFPRELLLRIIFKRTILSLELKKVERNF